MNKYFLIVSILGFLSVSSCSDYEQQPDEVPKEIPKDDPKENNQNTFPNFITSTNDYFEFSISGPSDLNEQTYRLKVSGLVDHPREFTLDELRGLNMYERTQTIECIGNIPNGELLSTSLWKGFKVIELLNTLGLKQEARTVNFICADGYISSNTLSELRSVDAIGALYANQDPLSSKMGFPLRILIPGYYGIKNPAWVTEIEVTNNEKKDYWLGSKWDIETPMEVDTKIFFPANGSQWQVGDTIRVGGAAFGNKEIKKVEYTLNQGKSWSPANIIRTGDNIHTWIFWEVTIIATQKGEMLLQSRATDVSGASQPLSDRYSWNGNNSSPSILLIIQ